MKHRPLGVYKERRELNAAIRGALKQASIIRGPETEQTILVGRDLTRQQRGRILTKVATSYDLRAEADATPSRKTRTRRSRAWTEGDIA